MRLRNVTQFFLLIGSVALVAYILFHNLAPFGVTVQYTLGNGNYITPLGPKDRVKQATVNGQVQYNQQSNLIYFTTNMPFNFDSATVTMVYKNPNPTQNVSVGFQDQDNWHYNLLLFDAPILNSLGWSHVGADPELFQRKKTYASSGDFLKNPPQNAIIGSFNYDTGIRESSIVTLPNYTQAKNDTVINMPMRGKVVFYVYLHNEPFHMIIQKQDLNWYPDPDVMNIKIYKDTSQVYSAQIDDDGITDGSKKVLPPQEVDIKNPGPGLPENGIYKIVIDAPSDSLLTKITTNLQKIVFQGPIFLAGNSDVYAPIASTSATALYTNALSISAMTYHKQGIQNISVGNDILSLKGTQEDQLIVPKDNFSKIVVPRNDVILNGFQGFFALTPDQFFLPTHYKQIAISSPTDVDLVDYILADYIPAQKVGDWNAQTRTFNLNSAIVKNGRLSWLIEAPGLIDNDGQIDIKSIQVTLKKRAIF